jgi:hypothetical protein
MRVIGSMMLAAAAILYGGLLAAQTEAAKNPASAKSPAVENRASGKKDGKARPGIVVTPEREAAVTTFVQRNHPELAELLRYLKNGQPAEYERAIREISRTIERLALISERDSLQYELEVAAWTAQSRVQLLAAKLKMESSDELQRELRTALAAQNDAKLALLKHERQKASERLSKIDSDISRIEGDREKLIDRQLQLLTQAAAEGRPAKLGAKNAAKQAKKNANPLEKKPTNP